LLRVHCGNVAAEQLPEVLAAGWKLSQGPVTPSSLHFDEIQGLQSLLGQVDLEGLRAEYSELVHRIRHAGIPVSDRRCLPISGCCVTSGTRRSSRRCCRRSSKRCSKKPHRTRSTTAAPAAATAPIRKVSRGILITSAS